MNATQLSEMFETLAQNARNSRNIAVAAEADGFSGQEEREDATIWHARAMLCLSYKERALTAGNW